MTNIEDLVTKTHNKMTGTMAEMYRRKRITERDNEFNATNSIEINETMEMKDSNKKALLRYKVRFAVRDR
jgi:hypothetical protein